VPLFSTCSKRELRLLAKMAVVEPRASGATLVTQGETGTDAFVILQGTCKVLRNGRRVATVDAGGIVGELSMLNRAPRNATVIAESPLEVAILQQAQFLTLLEQSPSISHKLLRILAARVQELDTRTPS
jgi:CRP-like cAMP-binding protein